MREFKFACPVCGQHITADATASGGQIACPTCFRNIVVPQAPASEDTKFILAAAHAPGSPLTSVGTAVKRHRNPSKNLFSLLSASGLLLLSGILALALFAFGERLFRNPPPEPEPQPGVTLTHTIEVYSNGSIKVDGNSYPSY